MACATPARLKMLLRPMLCTQHPSRAAITVTDIAARPADKKNREAFQHPGKTLESVAKPSTLKLAQCILPNNLVQRLKIPTVGVYSSVPFSEISSKQMNDRACIVRWCTSVNIKWRDTLFVMNIIVALYISMQREFRYLIHARGYLLGKKIFTGILNRRWSYEPSGSDEAR